MCVLYHEMFYFFTSKIEQRKFGRWAAAGPTKGSGRLNRCDELLCMPLY